ncbi:ATP synthase subunit I [Cupriavidus pauculus]|uniref:ATP synthase subunit I n=1 Tax=Cupriavidus pauculus TaxID=82633 RepID=UPI00398BFB46
MVVRDRQQGNVNAADPADKFRDPWDDDAEREEQVDPLSHAEAVKLLGERAMRPSRMTPGKVVLAQAVVTLLSAIAWAIFAREQGPSGWSAFFGGAVCVIPSGFFAFRLWMARARPTVGGLVAGEAIKIFATIALFVVVVVLYRDLRWVPMLVTFLLALKTYWVVALAVR